MASIYEPGNRLEVQTPKGDGIVWYLIDYGHETDTIYTIILDNGEIWQYPAKSIKVKSNITFGREVKTDNK